MTYACTGDKYGHARPATKNGDRRVQLREVPHHARPQENTTECLDVLGCEKAMQSVDIGRLLNRENS
jgi:hypothetical protein